MKQLNILCLDTPARAIYDLNLHEAGIDANVVAPHWTVDDHHPTNDELAYAAGLANSDSAAYDIIIINDSLGAGLNVAALINQNKRQRVLVVAYNIPISIRNEGKYQTLGITHFSSHFAVIAEAVRKMVPATA